MSHTICVINKLRITQDLSRACKSPETTQIWMKELRVLVVGVYILPLGETLGGSGGAKVYPQWSL